MSNMSMSSETVTPTVNTVTQAEKVAKRNAAFIKMSKPRRRVAIAKDVIAAMDAKKLFAKHGSYAENLGNGACNVCAIGGLFKAKISKCDLKTEDNNWRDAGKVEKEILAGLFDKRQLSLIENAFEQTQRYTSFDLKDDTVASETFRKRAGLDIYAGITSTSNDADYFVHDDAALRLIMQNIIKNKGEFKPEAV